MSGQSGCRSRSSRRRLVRKREMLDGPVGETVGWGAAVVDDVTPVAFARDETCTGLLRFAGARSDLVRVMEEVPLRCAMAASSRLSFGCLSLRSVKIP